MGEETAIDYTSVVRQIKQYVPDITEQELRRFAPLILDLTKSAQAQDTSRDVAAAVNELKANLQNLAPETYQRDIASPDAAEELRRLVLFLTSLAAEHRSSIVTLQQIKQKAVSLDVELVRFRRAIEDAADFISITDKHFNLIYANNSFLQKTGFSKAAIGQPLTKIWRSERALASLRRAMELLESSPSEQTHFTYEIIGVNSSGVEFPLQVNSTATRDRKGEIESMLNIGRDISALREAERKKDEFISIATHELRTPLTVIRGYANILARGTYGPINEKQLHYVERIAGSTQTLINLVGDMLNISKLEAQRMEFEIKPHKLCDILSGESERFHEACEEKRISFHMECDDDIVIMADDRRLVQVLDNLIGNAVKFTYEEGSIWLKAEPYYDDTMALVVVEDNGIGVPVEARPRLFHKFSQVDNVLQRQTSGTGLGLVICKNIVEKMGGTIWVEGRTEPKGSRFCFTVPRTKNEV